MTIPAILNDLLDYEEYADREAGLNSPPTYIWVKKGKKEEAWAVCALLGMVVDGDVKVDGHPVANTYIFARYQQPPELLNNVADTVNGYYAVGVETRFHLRDLQTYFEKWETDNATG